MDIRKIAEENLFFYTLTGSHAYGMATEHSDKDYRGLFYMPESMYISLFKTVEQIEGFGGQKDSIVFELSKYMRLLVEQNPNILELLWIDDKFIVQSSGLFEFLRSNRDSFLSSKAKHTFSGYAMSQLKRIKGHNKWINNPQPKRRPKEIDFVSIVWNATSNKEWNKVVPFKGFIAYELGGDIYGLIPMEHMTWHDRHEALVTFRLADNFTEYEDVKNFSLIVKFNRQLYKEHVDNWKHYWEWKEHRNEARSLLEEKHGYDTKHAAHLIRLFRMGIEILKGEGVKVLRPDANELLGIRNGSLTYDQLMKYVEDLDGELESLYKITKLPHSVDTDHADEIAQMIYYNGWMHDEMNKEIKTSVGIGYKSLGA